MSTVTVRITGEDMEDFFSEEVLPVGFDFDVEAYVAPATPGSFSFHADSDVDYRGQDACVEGVAGFCVVDGDQKREATEGEQALILAWLEANGEVFDEAALMQAEIDMDWSW